MENLEIKTSVTSTNLLARECAESGDATGLVLLAEQQTEGRGRRGRSWVSPYGCNLYLSTVWGFDGGVRAIEGLSLAVAVAVQRAIKKCGIDGVKLKWPNDLLWEKRKLGGILLEIIGDPAGFCQVVVGVGLNLGMPKQYSKDIDQSWANLSDLVQGPIDRNRLAGKVVDELLLMLGDYHKTGFEYYRDEWLKCDAYANEPVSLLLMRDSVKGIARGVDHTGALLLDVDGKQETYSGGEISLRGAE